MTARKPTYEELAVLVRQQAETIRELTEINRRRAIEITALKKRMANLEDQLRSVHGHSDPFRRRDELNNPDGQKKKPGRAKGHPGSYCPQPAVITEQV